MRRPGLLHRDAAGAALIQQVLNATTFLNLGQSWQYFFQGFLILVAAAIYTRARYRRTG